MKKKKAAVFWDYESFFWGLYNQHQYIPTREYIIGIMTQIKSRYKIAQMQAFGVFDHPALNKERIKLRGLNIEVIDCTPTQSQHEKKDYSDFLMLGGIYQTLIKNIKGDNNIEAFVLKKQRPILYKYRNW